MKYVVAVWLLSTFLGSHSIKIHRKRQLGNPADENFIFSTPEITAAIDLNGVEVQLEAFKNKENDQIMTLIPSNPVKASSLRFMSIGYPKIIMPVSPGRERSAVPEFVVTPTGFHFFVSTLTNEQKDKLASAATDKYQSQVAIKREQIGILVLSSFTCTAQFTLEKENTTITETAKGKATAFRTNPLKVTFKVERSNPIYSAIRTRLPLASVEITCEAAKGAHQALTDQLTIMSSQMDRLGVESKLLGPADNRFVSRNQLNQLRREIKQNLQIVETHESETGGFGDDFVNGFIENIGGREAFQPRPIAEVLRNLSPYNVNADLQPDEITRDLSDVLRIQTDADKKHVVVNRESSLLRREDSSSSGGGSLSGGGWGFELSASANYAQSKNSEWSGSSKSVEDQLAEINRNSQSGIKFERQGQKIVPKTLDVATVSRAQLSHSITFSRIRRKLSLAEFRQQFEMGVTLADTLPRIAEQRADPWESQETDSPINLRYLEECRNTEENGETGMVCHPGVRFPSPYHRGRNTRRSSSMRQCLDQCKTESFCRHITFNLATTICFRYSQIHVEHQPVQNNYCSCHMP